MNFCGIRLNTLTLSLLLLLPSLSQAQVTNEAVWNALIFQGSLGESPWGYWVEQQLRLNDGWSSDPSDPETTPNPIKTRGNRWILRPSLTYSPAAVPGLTYFLGYSWLPNLSPTRGEFRPWQQVLYSHNVGTPRLTHRLRLEQRDIERVDGLSHRLRYLARLAQAGKAREGAWGWAVWDEVFWNLNTPSGGPKGGFDQNRIFLGPQFQVDARTRLEFGYLQVRAAQGSAADSQLSHVASLFVFLDLDK